MPSLWGSNGNSTGATVYSYSGNTTTVTGPAGKTRTTTIDALGRLKTAQDGASTATYTYDALDNLTGVSQFDLQTSRTQARSFVYDSLSRLRSANNPETGLIEYTLKPGGQILTRQDARRASYRATYSYDELDRVTRIEYGDPGKTPTVIYCYDLRIYTGSGCSAVADTTISFGRGKLTSVGSAVSESRTTKFDALGRVLRSEQRTPGYAVPFAFAYEYNLGDFQTKVTYPSGRYITYTPTAANRIAQAVGTYGSASKTYGSGITYAPPGGLAAMTYNGPAVTQTWNYNSRGQVTESKAERAGVTLLGVSTTTATCARSSSRRGSRPTSRLTGTTRPTG
jgi:uncharacterized protein RhaS with RHS repeats